MVYCQCLEISILLTKDVPMLQLDFTHMTSPQGWHETCVYLPPKKKNPSGSTPEEQSTKVPYKFCKASKELAHCIGIDFKIGMFVGKQDRRWQRCTLKYLIFMTDVTCQKVLVLSGLVPRLSLSGGISLLGYVTFVIYGLNLMHWLACLEGLKHLLHRQILCSKLLCFLY